MSLLSLLGFGRSNRPAPRRGRPRLALEILEDRVTPSTTRFVVDPTLADPRVNTYVSIAAALNAAGTGDIIQLEAGAQIAAGTNVTVNKAVVIQADQAFGAKNFPPLSFTLSAGNVTLNNLTIGGVTIAAGATGETIENSIIIGDSSLGYGISETTTALPPNGVNGNNLIQNNRFITTSAAAPANIILANDTYPASLNPGLVGGDRVLNNVFTSTVATQFFSSGSFFISARHEGASKDTATTPAPMAIQGNTITDYDVNGASQGIVLIDDTGAVSQNTITLFPNAGNVALTIKDFIPPVFQLSPKHYATATTNLTVDDNTFDTGYQGDGVDSTRTNSDTTNTVYKVELSDNNFVSNIVGLRVTGFGSASSDAFGTIDAGGGSLGSLGGNDLQSFGGGTNNFAILVTNNNAGGNPTVEAKNNIFGPFTPSGVISEEFGTNVDTSTTMTGFRATLQIMYHDILGRSPGASEVATFTNIDNTQGIAAVAHTVVFNPEHYTDLVRGLYVQLLGRPGSAPEWSGWVAMLNANGGAIERVIAGMAGTAEYYNRAAQLFPGGDPDAAVIQGLYHDLLGRTPSASEVRNWLPSVRQSGAFNVALAFANSAEFRTLQVEAMYFEPSVVNAVLETPLLLHRRTAPSASDLSGWANSSVSLLAIESFLLQSPEFASNG